MADMSDTLCFFKPGFAFLQVTRHHLQRFLRALAIRDVLHRSEHVIGLAGRVPFHIALKVGDAHFADWPDHATFGAEAGPAAESLFHASLPIFGVDLFLTRSYVHRTFLRPHSTDAIGLIRPVHATR